MGSCRQFILNDTANTAYARVAPHGRDLRQPGLFVNRDWDPSCDINCSPPRRAHAPLLP